MKRLVDIISIGFLVIGIICLVLLLHSNVCYDKKVVELTITTCTRFPCEIGTNCGQLLSIIKNQPKDTIKFLINLPPMLQLYLWFGLGSLMFSIILQIIKPSKKEA